MQPSVQNTTMPCAPQTEVKIINKPGICLCESQQALLPVALRAVGVVEARGRVGHGRGYVSGIELAPGPRVDDQVVLVQG